MKNINYRAILCIGLLSLNALFSCTSTKQAIKPREEMVIDMPGNAKKTHNKNWSCRQWFVWGLAGLSGIGGLGYLYNNTGISSPSNITGLNNINFTPENLNGHDVPRAEMLMADMSNTTGYDPDLFSGRSLIDTINNQTFSEEAIIGYIEHKARKIDLLEIKRNRSPLICAMFRNRTNVSIALINKLDREDLNRKYFQEMTALTCAIKYNKLDIARLLITKMNKEDLDIKDSSGWPPLLYALQYKHMNIVDLLLKKEVNIDIIDKLKRTTLTHAILSGEIDFAKSLINKTKKENLNIRDDNQRCPLMYAIERGYTDIEELLIKKIMDLTDEDMKGHYSFLTYAAQHNKYDFVKFLIGAKSQVNKQYRDIELISALMITINNNNKDIAGLLIDTMDKNYLGLTYNDYSRKITYGIIGDAYIGMTPLISAVKSGRIEIANLLIKKMNKKDLSQKDNYGRIALIYAVINNQTNVADLLIEKMDKESIIIQDQYKKGASAYAISLNRTDIQDLLMKKAGRYLCYSNLATLLPPGTDALNPHITKYEENLIASWVAYHCMSD